MRTSPRMMRSSGYKSETKHIIQRQRVIRSFLNKPDEIDFQPSPRKPIVVDTQPTFLSITSISPSSSTSQPLISDLNDQSTNSSNRQLKLDRHSPLLFRRHRPTLESLSQSQPPSDTLNVSSNQLSIPTNFTFKNRPTRLIVSDQPSPYRIKDRIRSPRIPTLKYTKLSNEMKQNQFKSKSTYQNRSPLIPIWTATSGEQETTQSRTRMDVIRTRPSKLQQSLQIGPYLKPNDIQELYISPRVLSNSPQDLDTNTTTMEKKELNIDEWEDIRSTTSGVSNEDESINNNGNSSTSTCYSQTLIEEPFDKSSTSTLEGSPPKTQRSSIKPRIPRRRPFNIPLPPVVENVDEEIGDD
ncbi:unnamed protein product [Adineta ricciae]|uniref:Uncharacterized protein n=1 Tax=Adineta ricciae TaxID=249248 RepID=A0A815DCI6_ADIRI|nr:unnamed protein product [Adineta ricciae]